MQKIENQLLSKNELNVLKLSSGKIMQYGSKLRESHSGHRIFTEADSECK